MRKNDMTSMERIMAVLRRELPDRVPLVLQSREFGLKYYAPNSKKPIEIRIFTCSLS